LDHRRHIPTNVHCLSQCAAAAACIVLVPSVSPLCDAGRRVWQSVSGPMVQPDMHSSTRLVATTYIYLDHLAGCQDTVDAAVEELLSGIETPQRTRSAA
jgi:hypothetical protein